MSPSLGDAVIGNTKGIDASHDDFFIGDRSVEQRRAGMVSACFPAMNDLIAFAMLIAVGVYHRFREL